MESGSLKESPTGRGVVISCVIFAQTTPSLASFPSFSIEQQPDIALIRDSVTGLDLYRRGSRSSLTDFPLNG